MSASARATVRRWVLSSLQGAGAVGVPAAAVAPEMPLLLPQPAATNARPATVSARVPVNRDTAADLSGS